MRLEAHIPNRPGFTSHIVLAMFHIGGLLLDWQFVFVDNHVTNLEATFLILRALFTSVESPFQNANFSACGLTSLQVTWSHEASHPEEPLPVRHRCA